MEFFPCGCIVDEDNLDMNDISLECPAIWKLLKDGLTKGVFQLESGLGRQWCQKLKPENIEQLAALVALMRPGCLRAEDEDGVSMTEHYCRRKNFEEPVVVPYDCIEEILAPTYQVLCYQEQSIEIVKRVGGFNLQEADNLRKACGKKIASEMEKVKIKFLEKAKEVGLVNQEEADEIIGWIEKSNRYSFNKSHAVGYAFLGYWSAWCKAHYPLFFFTQWLHFSHEKMDQQQEIRELVNEAKLMDIEIKTPHLLDFQSFFYPTNDGKVRFGLVDIKGVGLAAYNKLLESQDILKHSISWFNLLRNIFKYKIMSSKVFEALVSVGAFDYLGKQRQEMLYDYEIYDQLSVGEIKFIGNLDTDNLIQALKMCASLKKNGGGCHTEKHVLKLESLIKLYETPPKSLKDTPSWTVIKEQELLGLPLTHSYIDGCDLSEVNCTCKDIMKGYNDYAVFIARILQVKTTTTKKGKNPGKEMAILTIDDGTCTMSDVLVFPSQFEQLKSLINEGTNALFVGNKDKKTKSFIVQNIQSINE